MARAWLYSRSVGMGAPPPASAVTDGDGEYSMPAVKAYAGSDAVGWLLVGASKPGYFADFKWWLDFPKDSDLDLRLEPLTVPIALGEAIRGQIGERECAGLGDPNPENRDSGKVKTTRSVVS